MKQSCFSVSKDARSVHELFSNFKDDRLPFLLESSLPSKEMGRYSIFSSDPFLTFSFKQGRCLVEKDGKTHAGVGAPLAVLRDLLGAYHLKESRKNPLPFLCGAVGFLSYDFGFSLERFDRKHVPDKVVPEIMFGFYDCAVIVDHWKKELNVFSSGFPEKGSRRPVRARARMDAIMRKLAARPKESRDRQRDPGSSKKISSNFSKEGYLAVIRKAKDYIARGDIYQVNLSQRFATRSNIEDWRLYQRLVKNFPVCFSGFFKTEDFSILSASPERFLNFDGRTVTTRPMKGTRRRTQDPLLNKKLKEELSLSKKEKAELLMIVDLERNDLGRVCAYGSVKVNHLRQIEAYRSVFQATAEVEGLLHKSMDRIDLLRACFPGGSVTGCPKIRSMEIIEELEPEPRSVYTGALGFLSFHNTMEFNVLIRSFLKKKDEVSFHAGGGIVTDSEPEAEYEETLIKARTLFEALTGEHKDGSGLARR